MENIMIIGVVMNLFSDYKYSEDSKENPFLITWVTHNSRINNHLIEIGITELNPVILLENEQEIITNAINEKALKDNIKIIEYNILKDHIHIIILTEKSKLENIVRDFKGYSAFIYFKSKNLTKEGTGRKNKLWAKHYNISFITSEENYINAIEYVKNNKIKHQEKENLLKNK